LLYVGRRERFLFFEDTRAAARVRRTGARRRVWLNLDRVASRSEG
jgi:hypothetical protein